MADSDNQGRFSVIRRKKMSGKSINTDNMPLGTYFHFINLNFANPKLERYVEFTNFLFIGHRKEEFWIEVSEFL